MATNPNSPAERPQETGIGPGTGPARPGSSPGFRRGSFARAIRGGGDADRTFEAVVRAVQTWRDWNADVTVRRVPYAIKRALDEELNADAESVWERNVVELPSGKNTCDVVVNGAIGVVVIRSLSYNTITEFRQRLRVLSQQYTHLLLFAYRLPRKDNDQWRVIAQRLLASDVDVERIVTVESFDAGGSPSGGKPSDRRLGRITVRGAESLLFLIVVGLLATLARVGLAWAPGVGIEMRAFLIMLAAFYAAVLLFAGVYLRVLS
jgi:hypothetical protein